MSNSDLRKKTRLTPTRVSPPVTTDLPSLHHRELHRQEPEEIEQGGGSGSAHCIQLVIDAEGGGIELAST